MTDSAGHRNHSMLEAILDSAVGAIISINKRGLIQTVNPATVQLFGYAEAELIGQNVKILMPQHYKAHHDQYISHHLETGERKIIGIGRDVEGQRKDGTQFPLHLSVSAFEIDGETHFAGIMHDLTSRAALKAEVERQVTIFHSVFDQVPIPMLITDTDHRIRMLNPASVELLGYRFEDLEGMTTSAIYESPEEFERVAHELSSLSSQRGESLRLVEAAFRQKSGQVFPGQLVAAFIHSTDGLNAGILTLIHDRTDEHKLREGRVKAQRLEAIGQLTGGVAHDFNNLLTVISGNLEILEDYVADDRGRDHLNRAVVATAAGARLIDRMMKFASRGRLQPQALNINQHVRTMGELLERTLGGNIELLMRLAPDLWTSLADPSELENAIVNLALNARDAMPDGGRLVIETTNVTLDADTTGLDGLIAAGDYTRVSVSDTGIGMSPEVISRAFEPFFTTKPSGRGTGLGLSTIYGFVKQSKGNVSVYSELGQGTTISLYLPRFLNDGVQPAQPRGGELSAVTTNETILVVEDNADVRAVTLERLARLGYRTISAINVADAISKLEADLKIDAVFSDVVMPGGNSGFDLATWIAANRPKLPVLLTSGFAEDVAPRHNPNHPEILRKPYAQVSLARALRLVIEKKKMET